MTEITDEWAMKLWLKAWQRGISISDQAAATLIKARVSALMAERDAVDARLRDVINHSPYVLDGAHEQG